MALPPTLSVTLPPTLSVTNSMSRVQRLGVFDQPVMQTWVWTTSVVSQLWNILLEHSLLKLHQGQHVIAVLGLIACSCTGLAQHSSMTTYVQGERSGAAAGHSQECLVCTI